MPRPPLAKSQEASRRISLTLHLDTWDALDAWAASQHESDTRKRLAIIVEGWYRRTGKPVQARME